MGVLFVFLYCFILFYLFSLKQDYGIFWLHRIKPVRTGVPVSYVQLLFFPTEQQEFRQMYVINSEMLICTADERLNNSIVIKLKLFIPWSSLYYILLHTSRYITMTDFLMSGYHIKRIQRSFSAAAVRIVATDL